MNYPNNIEDAKKHTYNFWKNKPVVKFDEISTYSGNIESKLTDRQVYNLDEPIKLPSSMNWNVIDLSDESNLLHISEFLKLHYVSDESNTFKMDYSPEFIKWSLGESGSLIAITLKSNNAICGVVGYYLKNMVVFDKTEKFGVVNFLCSHPAYRKKKIAFTLIDEITRRIVKSGVNQGCFTTGRCVPTPITCIRYYHRPINYIKLKTHKFTIIDSDEKEDKITKNDEKIAKVLKISDEFPKNFIKIPKVLELYNKFMFRFNIYNKYTEEELKTMLLNNNIVKSYVILKDDEIVDFTSYFILDYLVDNTTEKLHTGYLFLYSSETLISSEIIKETINSTQIDNLDLFNVIDVGNMFDALLLKDTGLVDSDYESYQKSYNHHFMKGTGKLYFNFFNWKCQEVLTNQIFINVL